MTECRLLFVSSEKSFLVNSLISGIESEGIECICIQPEVNLIDNIKHEVDMILLYAEDTVDDMTDVIVYIKDLCSDDIKTLYLAGSAFAIKTIEDIIPAELIKKEYARPFDVKQMIQDIMLEARVIEERRGQKTVLVVDDDVTFLRFIKKLLMDTYNVIIVKSGIQAIKYLTVNKPDLILMDYDMPVTTGSKVLEMIRTESDLDNIPVFFLTGKADRETVLEVMELKPQGYLLKSMPREEILAAIDNYFDMGR